MIKNLSAHAGDARDVGSIPGSGRSPGVGNDKPPQYSCPENSVDSGVWQVTVRGVAKESDTAEHGAHEDATFQDKYRMCGEWHFILHVLRFLIP